MAGWARAARTRRSTSTFWPVACGSCSRQRVGQRGPGWVSRRWTTPHQDQKNNEEAQPGSSTEGGSPKPRVGWGWRDTHQGLQKGLSGVWPGLTPGLPRLPPSPSAPTPYLHRLTPQPPPCPPGVSASHSLTNSKQVRSVLGVNRLLTCTSPAVSLPPLLRLPRNAFRTSRQ